MCFNNYCGTNNCSCGQRNRDMQCIYPAAPSCCCCQENPCGIVVEITTPTNCTRLCSQVTYTITVTNDCDMPLTCSALAIRIPYAECLVRDSFTLNGNPIENANPDCIDLGTLEAGATATITYTVTIMENQRFVKTAATFAGTSCCCCEMKRRVERSNCHVIQVCPCCACCNETNN